MSEIEERLSSSELAENARQLDRVLADAEDLVTNLNEDAFRWRPSEGAWSISECLQHLSVTLDQYEPLILGAIQEGRESGRTGEGPPRRGWLNGWFIKTLEPPVKFRVKTPKKFDPGEPKGKAEVYPRFVERHDALRSWMGRADGLDLWRNRLYSPITKLMRLSLGEAFALMLAHDRRHLWQARRVTEAPGFPGR